MYIRDSFLDSTVLPDQIEPKQIRYFWRKLEIPIHHFWHPDIAEQEAQLKIEIEQTLKADADEEIPIKLKKKPEEYEALRRGPLHFPPNFKPAHYRGFQPGRRARTIRGEVFAPVKRNTVVLFVVLFLLAAFGWAGWANWESRRQAATRAAAMAAPADLVMPGSDADLPPTIAPMLDKPAPDFTLEDVRGKKVSLDAYKGKAVLINFWATWCGPCKIETPWLVDLRNQYAAKGFEILAVSEDDLDPGDKQKLKEETQQIASFAEQMHMDYPVLLGGDALSKPYGGLDSLPTSFFVDRNGKVVAAQVGLTSKDEIEGNIRKALGGQS